MTDFAMIAGTDHWLRVSHENTSVDMTQGIVQLAWQHTALYGTELESPQQTLKPAGLAFDPWCRVYHSVPEEDRVERLLWDNKHYPERAKSLFKTIPAELGDFLSTQALSEVSRPQGIAVDRKGRLFVADSAHQRILIFDLTDNTLIRSVNVNGQPSALCCDGSKVIAIINLTDTSMLLQFDATSSAESVHMEPMEGSELSLLHDVTVDQTGRVFVLLRAITEQAVIWAIDGRNEPIYAPYASAVLAIENQQIVIARAPNSDFLRFRVTPQDISELPQLQARHYDGRGIAVDPMGKVAYWTSKGVMHATVAQIKYVNQGRIICFRLDNQEIQRRWGRIFIDACIPVGGYLKVGFIVSDESEIGPQMHAQPPVNVAEFELTRPDLTPPLPSVLSANSVQAQQTLHRRSQHRELPWSFTDKHWRTYEAPVNAPAGRYLWLVVDLYGKSHVSPKIKNIRVEYPAIDMLRRLPRVFAGQGAASDFLHRYLSLLNSNFDELDKRSVERQRLLDPQSTPEAMLPWLSSLLGMELDNRWSEVAKRQILQQAMWLFKYRGTVAGLKRFIEIYLQRNITLIEHFQVRGLGGAFVGQSDALAANSILGAGFRIGGKLGETALSLNQTQRVSTDYQSPITMIDSNTQHAHRFSVIVPVILSVEQRAVIEHILDIHRPAHTLFDICSVDSGMRIGSGLHLGMTSVVGCSSGFGQLQVGNSILGQTDVLGQAKSGMTVGNTVAGLDSRVG
jgi:phage tail-like protein